jgi:hypothetical protein
MCFAPKAQHSSQVRHGTDSLWRTWGIAPGFMIPKTPALKARINRDDIETRFQR